MSFKVICIDGISLGEKPTPRSEQSGAASNEVIYEGETYTVIASEYHERLKIVGYELLERRKGTYYNSKRFAPCSEIDETEMTREYQTQPA